MRILSGSLALLLMGSAAWAADDADRSAARATITQQIEAFKANDPATAYAQAAPQIQAMFTSPEMFLAMVEQGYKPVLHPRSYSFDKVEATEDGLAQELTLQDEAGTDWQALYLLQKQADGRWLITGCTLKKAPGDKA